MCARQEVADDELIQLGLVWTPRALPGTVTCRVDGRMRLVIMAPVRGKAEHGASYKACRMAAPPGVPCVLLAHALVGQHAEDR